MARARADGSRDTLTLPNHQRIQSGTLRSACTQGNVTREAFIEAYDRS